MPSTYYCDMSEGTYADRTGNNNGADVLTGPAGLQAAIRGTGFATALAAGDTLEIKAGTGAEKRLVTIDCNGTDVSNWDLDDRVRNKDGAGDDWDMGACEPTYLANCPGGGRMMMGIG